MASEATAPPLILFPPNAAIPSGVSFSRGAASQYNQTCLSQGRVTAKIEKIKCGWTNFLESVRLSISTRARAIRSEAQLSRSFAEVEGPYHLNERGLWFQFIGPPSKTSKLEDQKDGTSSESTLRGDVEYGTSAEQVDPDSPDGQHVSQHSKTASIQSSLKPSSSSSATCSPTPQTRETTGTYEDTSDPAVTAEDEPTTQADPRSEVDSQGWTEITRTKGKSRDMKEPEPEPASEPPAQVSEQTQESSTEKEEKEARPVAAELQKLTGTPTEEDWKEFEPKMMTIFYECRLSRVQKVRRVRAMMKADHNFDAEYAVFHSFIKKSEDKSKPVDPRRYQQPSEIDVHTPPKPPIPAWRGAGGPSVNNIPSTTKRNHKRQRPAKRQNMDQPKAAKSPGKPNNEASTSPALLVQDTNSTGKANIEAPTPSIILKQDANSSGKGKEKVSAPSALPQQDVEQSADAEPTGIVDKKTRIPYVSLETNRAQLTDNQLSRTIKVRSPSLSVWSKNIADQLVDDEPCVLPDEDDKLDIVRDQNGASHSLLHLQDMKDDGLPGDNQDQDGESLRRHRSVTPEIESSLNKDSQAIQGDEGQDKGKVYDSVIEIIEESKPMEDSEAIESDEERDKAHNIGLLIRRRGQSLKDDSENIRGGDAQEHKPIVTRAIQSSLNESELPRADEERDENPVHNSAVARVAGLNQGIISKSNGIFEPVPDSYQQNVSDGEKYLEEHTLGSLAFYTHVVPSLDVPRHRMVLNYIHTQSFNAHGGGLNLSFGELTLPIIFVNPEQEAYCLNELLRKRSEYTVAMNENAQVQRAEHIYPNVPAAESIHKERNNEHQEAGIERAAGPEHGNEESANVDEESKVQADLTFKESAYATILELLVMMDQPDRAKNIEARLFDHFKRMEKISNNEPASNQGESAGQENSPPSPQAKFEWESMRKILVHALILSQNSNLDDLLKGLMTYKPEEKKSIPSPPSEQVTFPYAEPENVGGSNPRSIMSWRSQVQNGNDPNTALAPNPIDFDIGYHSM